jgi:hypothetical protein
MTFMQCYELAQEIEWIHAREIARIIGGRSKRCWHQFYDPHAATELGSLIYNRQFTKSGTAPRAEIAAGSAEAGHS